LHKQTIEHTQGGSHIALYLEYRGDSSLSLFPEYQRIKNRTEQCLRRHLRVVKPVSVNYAVELVYLGLDSMTAVALLLDMEKMFDIRFPDDMLVQDTFPGAFGLIG